MSLKAANRENITCILKEFWGFDQFRPLQEDIILSVLGKTDTLALLPTGGGKSVCYQVPALSMEGLCIVITPLIALMQDQVDQLEKKGIKVLSIHSGMGKDAIDITLDNAIYGNYKFLFVSPERLKTELFKARVRKMNVSMLAVDEAHCISQWGYDFRPAYLEISEIRTLLPEVPILALTATATGHVIQDIQEKLHFLNPTVIKGSYFRNNLSLKVIHAENKNQVLLNLLKNKKESAIVYTRSRKMTVETADFLNKSGISSAYYHAGLKHEIRNAIQADWINNKFPVMVSTNAFGMGIDKADVRQVIHLMPPDNLEAYVQEAGRAGRDGKFSIATLIVSPGDADDMKERVLKSYPDATTIKRVYHALANHFRIPIGTGKDEIFRVRPLEFCKKYKISYLDFINSLKILQSNTYIELSESLLSSSSIRFFMRQDALYQFQLKHADLDPLIKLLLRSYGGLFDQYVKIDEELIAKKLNMSKAHLEKKLTKLTTYKVLDYKAASSLPFIRYTSDRINEDYLRLDPDTYQNRKALALDRMEYMTRYFTDNKCRNHIMLSYFDEKSDSCGICDVCLKAFQKPDNEKAIKKLIIKLSQLQAFSIDELSEFINVEDKKTIVTAVRALIDENLLKQSGNGKIEKVR